MQVEAVADVRYRFDRHPLRELAALLGVNDDVAVVAELEASLDPASRIDERADPVGKICISVVNALLAEWAKTAFSEVGCAFGTCRGADRQTVFELITLLGVQNDVHILIFPGQST